MPGVLLARAARGRAQRTPAVGLESLLFASEPIVTPSEILQPMSDLGSDPDGDRHPVRRATGRVNEESFVALMHHLAENGSDGFVVAGTTGEASTLTDDEQLGLIELAVAERPPGKTIIAGTGTNDTRQAVAPDRTRAPSSASTRRCR